MGWMRLRGWWRAAGGAERRATVLVSTVVLGLVGWALVPGPAAGGGSGASAVAAGTGAGATAGPGGTGGGVASGTADTGPGGVPAGKAGAGGGPIGTSGVAGSGQPPSGGGAGASASPAGVGPSTSSGGRPGGGCPAGATDRGVTATGIRLGVAILDLAGPIGNAAVNLASPDEQQRMAQSVVDAINAAGGIQCRRIVPVYYQVNPVDSTNQHAECLQMAQDGVFAVVDSGGFAYPIGARDCLAQQHIPFIGVIGLIPSEARLYYPYLMSPAADMATSMKDLVYGMREQGYFSPAHGFYRLGVLEDDCSTEVDGLLRGDLSAIGIGGSQMVTSVFSCPPSGFASPGDMEQAVVRFRSAGVTNVIPLTGGGSFNEFTKLAQQQGFHPHYTISDYDGLISTSGTSQAPDAANFDGTVSVTPSHAGELASGLSDPGTQACLRVLTSHGLPASDIGAPGGGVYCTVIDMFADAARYDPGLTRARLVAGLDRVGSVQFAYPYGPGVFDRPGQVSGGSAWWPIQWHATCTCWKVLDAKMAPNF